MGNLGDDVEEAVVEHTKKTAAREIIKKIKGWLSSDPSMAKRRWPFELLQNAIDTAKKRQHNQLKIEIKMCEKDGNQFLIIKHNGGPFSHEELCAIIYGGTTKMEPFAPETKYVGRFGRGFLVTHILNRNVEIRGIGEDKDKVKHSFEISIDRTSEDEGAIVSQIETCFDQLRKAPIMEHVYDEWCAEYIYELKDALGKDAAKVGIETLEKLMPLVLTFNEDLIEIIVNDRIFTKSKEEIDANLSKFSIALAGERYSNAILLYIYQDIAVGAMLRNDEILRIADDIPRLFISMPLMGSEKIPIPFVIGSLFLEPTEERDAVLLAGDSEDAKCNKKLLEEAFNYFYEIVKFCAQEDYKQLHHLCHFMTIPKEYRTEKEEFWKFWEEKTKNCVRALQELEIIKTSGGYKKPSETLFPIPRIKNGQLGDDLTKEQFTKFYDLLNEIKTPLPVKEIAYDWQLVARFWRDIEEGNLSFCSLESLRDDIKNASLVEGYFQSISTVAKKFGLEDNQLKELLRNSFELLDQLYNEKKINSDFVDGLLLNQNSTILQRSFTIPDINGKKLSLTLGTEKEKIPDELKNISKEIAYDVKMALLDEEFSHFGIAKDFLAKEISTDDVIEEILKCKPAPGQKVDFDKNERDKGWAKLFVWCIVNDKVKVGLPVSTKDNVFKVVEHINSDPLLLLPFEEVGMNKEYEELLPESRILNCEYFNLISDQDKGIFRKKIVEKKICFDDVIQRMKKLRMKKEKLKAILVDDEVELKGKEHEMTTEVETISNLLFWTETIGRINQVPDRARKYVDFLLNVVCERDGSWRGQIQADCSCEDGRHRIIPAEWLANLKCDSWVPVQKSDEEGQIVPREATRENIEKLLCAEKINEIIKSNIGVELLSHFGFDKLDLKIKRKSIDLNKPERAIREELVQVSERDDVLSLVQYSKEDIMKVLLELSESEEKERKAQENQITGHVVEDIVREILLEKGILEPRMVFAGADIEIWPQEEGWDGGRVILFHYLIEIKFTTGNRVRLSKKQSEVAGKT